MPLLDGSARLAMLMTPRRRHVSLYAPSYLILPAPVADDDATRRDYFTAADALARIFRRGAGATPKRLFLRRDRYAALPRLL